MADPIPFTRGVPSADMLPVDDMRAALATAMEREPVVALSYPPGGHKGLRTWIGARHGAPAERVVCANGSLEIFAFVAGVLLARGATARVLVEAPSYDRSILILKRAGAEVVGIPVDGDGIETDALAAELERGPARSSTSSRTSRTRAEPRCRSSGAHALLELARQHGTVVVEDDPYGLLRWAGETLPQLCALDPDNVVTLSSFTKTVAPGLRVGYAVASAELAAAIGAYAENTYISPCMVSQAGLAAYCEAGYFEPGVERATHELKARCDAMVEAVREHFPAEVRMVVPKGGYFLWLDLGPGADTTALAARAAEAGVPFVKGADFFADGGGTTSLRLAFSAVPADRIREGIERLGAVIASVTLASADAARRSPQRQPRVGGGGRPPRRRLLPPARGAAGAALSLDRLLRQPRARERDHGHRPGRGLRAPQRRERRRAHRSQLPLGAAVRRRGARRRGDRGLRPPRLRRGARPRSTDAATG